MSYTTRTERRFVDAIIPDGILDYAIAWIASNLEPQEVFSFDRLCEWAANQGFRLEKP